MPRQSMLRLGGRESAETMGSSPLRRRGLRLGVALRIGVDSNA